MTIQHKKTTSQSKYFGTISQMQNPNGEMRNQCRNEKPNQASIPSISHTNHSKQRNSQNDQPKASLKPNIPDNPADNTNSKLT